MQLREGASRQILQFNCDGVGDPHQPSRFQAAAGELGEAQPSELCPSGLNDHFSRQPTYF